MKTELQMILMELRAMRLSPMATCLADWVAEPNNRNRSVLDCVQEMIGAQRAKMDGSRVRRFFHRADLPPSACLSDLRASEARGLAPKMVAELGTGEWIRHGHQLIIMGPSGTGKTYIASALSAQARLKGFQVEYHRLAELWDTLDELKRKDRKKFITRLTKVPLLVLDDFVAQKISTKQGYELLKVLDARNRHERSTMVAAPNHRHDWEDYFEDPTTADAICVRLDRKAQVIELKRTTPP